jgi:hypothetical protein
MIALGFALLCFVAGIALQSQPNVAIVRAALYGAGAASLAYWLLGRLPPRPSAPEQAVELPARLYVLSGAPRHIGKSLPVQRVRRVFGKAFACRIERTAHGFTLTDSGAPHGVYLNGRPLTPNLPVPLHSGDEIAFGLPQRGAWTLRFYAELFPQAPVSAAETQRMAAPSALEMTAPLDSNRTQFFNEVQRVARRTGVLPLVLPSAAERATPAEQDRHDA